MTLFGLFGPPNVEKLKVGRNISGLVKALFYRKDWSVRAEAARALREIGDSRAVELLILKLTGPNYINRDVIMATVQALGEIGDSRAVEPLLAALKGSKGSMFDDPVLHFAKALGEIGDPGTRALVEMMNIDMTKHSEMRDQPTG